MGVRGWLFRNLEVCDRLEECLIRYPDFKRGDFRATPLFVLLLHLFLELLDLFLNSLQLLLV